MTNSSNIKLVVASTDPKASLADYLRNKNINADSVANVRPGDLKVPGTPFLILVDDDGRVARIWRGRLSSTQEKEVLSLFLT